MAESSNFSFHRFHTFSNVLIYKWILFSRGNLGRNNSKRKTQNNLYFGLLNRLTDAARTKIFIQTKKYSCSAFLTAWECFCSSSLPILFISSPSSKNMDHFLINSTRRICIEMTALIKFWKYCFQSIIFQDSKIRFFITTCLRTNFLLLFKSH